MSHLWWRTLDHQINFWDVQTTGCHIGGHQNLKRAIPEAFQCGLSLFLRNVSVEGLGTLKTKKENIGQCFTIPTTVKVLKTCLKDK